MKIQKRDLQHALNQVGKTVGEKSPVEDYKKVVFEITPNGTTLTTSKIDSGSQYMFDELKGECVFSVDYKAISNAVRVVNGEISLSLNDSKLQLKAGKTKINVTVIPSKLDLFTEFEIDFTETDNNLISSISRVINNASTDDSRPVLKGVLIEKDNVVATDGRRLAVEEVNTGFEALIPINEARSIVSLFGGEKIKCCSTESRLYVTNNKLTMFCSHIDGVYPNWKGIISKPSEKIVINASEMTEILNSVSAVGNLERLDVNIENNIMEIKSTSDVTDIKSEMNVEGNSSVNLLFNPSFVKTALASFSGEIDLLHSGSEAPCWFTNGTCKVILMPMRG